jgi:hypothetical protein
VSARIQQHVAECIRDLLRRREQAQVVAVGEHRSDVIADAVHRSGEPRADRHHAAPEGVRIACFDEQVRVIALQRIVDEATARPPAPARERTFDLTDDGDSA